MAELALTRGYQQIGGSDRQDFWTRSPSRRPRTAWAGCCTRAASAVDYSLDRESQAVRSAWDLKEGLADLAVFAQQQKARVERAVRIAPRRWGSVRSRRSRRRGIRKRRRSSCGANAWARSRSTICRRQQREGYPAASFWGVPVSALYWCDGKRNLAEVIRLTELEMGPQQFDFVGYFKFLEKHGYVEFAR